MNTTLKQFVLFTGFAVAMLATGVSSAAFMDGCYVSANGAVNWLKTQTYKVQTGDVPVGTTVNLRTNTGWEGELAVGSQSEPYRLEAAVDFLSNKVKNGTSNVPEEGGVGDIFSVSTSGRVNTTTLLINGYYDFAPKMVWTPYVGVGLGVANINANVSAVEPISQAFGRLHDNSTEFAYQGIVGASWKIAERLRANLDYRYLRTATATLNISNGSPFSPINSGIVKSRYASSRVLGGLAYSFD